MKRNLLVVLCAVAVALAGQSTASARTQNPDAGAAAIADVVIVRPVCLAATVIGSAFFMAALPFAWMSGSVDRTADVLVVAPARATFTRPVGDLEALRDYSY